MNKEFVTYKQALALTKLGFVGPAMGLYYEKGKELYYGTGSFSSRRHENILAPLYSEAFKWLRDEYLTYGIIIPINVSKIQGIDCILEIYPPPDEHGLVHVLKDAKVYASYEEAEQTCLKKLIELVKNEKQK